MLNIELILLGLFVGGITGITGASGVLVLVPILSTFFDFSLPVVLGTSLLVDVVASLSVSISYARLKNLDVKSSVWILVGSLLGAQVGSFFVVSVSKILIMAVLSVCMIFFGVKIWQNGISNGSHSTLRLPKKFSILFRNPISMVFAGLFIGLTTGIFGAGGGLTVFVFLYSVLDFPIKKAIGTSSFIMLFTALSGMIGYAENGNLNINLGIIIGISAAIGGAFSSVIANKLKESFLDRLVGGFFIFFALVMIVLKIALPLFNISF
ncbi:sulfite exporter TauE/SafE family protein [Patescibacteria group bacterium]|nr:sulfite exporter TauE/SafE family protein [Patescibacteria group bacterium]MBU1728136.1 sulfite exporter TauE/SafE family protein [Patescibacteria group bacterium]